jgi:hypothetical protein
MTEDQRPAENVLNSSDMPTGVGLICGVYWVTLIAGVFVLTFISVGMVESPRKYYTAEILLGLMTNVMILYGLNKRKNWIPPFILFYSTWGLFSQFIRIVGQSATSSSSLTTNFGRFLSGMFFVYQIYLFTRKDIKLYFREKGQTIY